MNRGSGCCRPTPYHLATAPYFRFCEYATFVHKNENRFCPHYCKGWYSLFGNILKYSKKVNCWSGLRGSNSLPPPWQGGALPDELNPHLYKPPKRYFSHMEVFLTNSLFENKIYSITLFSTCQYLIFKNFHFGTFDKYR